MGQILENLALCQTNEEKLDHLKASYPCLYIFALNRIEKKAQAQDFMAACSSLASDPKTYSMYVHGNFLPWILQ